ncbi:MAG: toll/interleukin-1 receptor domain-containing protein [Alphaproteobacteria bacterium]|nr:toll/interleukin-1 receptor domain-containing protein [Alphaproteobacteria bacterium]
MADIFISYASEDRNRVRPLAEALQERGFNVWWDRSLAAGQDYTAIIEKELKDAKAVIVLWTQSSANSTFVRDEAGRARDEGRLVPIMLDSVQIPLGFGAFQAEDFTRWNGGANAPQMQLLVEVLSAKLSGREVNSNEIQRRRSRLGMRVRIVSVLTVIALIAGIAWVVNDFVRPNPPPPDLRAELLRLLADGQLTPEQAIQLAQILESGALGETSEARLGAPSPGAASETAPSAAPTDGVVSQASFEETASAAYREAFVALAAHPDAEVRLAVAQMSQDSTRDAAMQTLWAYANAHPEDPLRDQIYLLCGSVGEVNNNPLGQRALEQATSLRSRDPAVWRMLSRSYSRVNRSGEAEAAAQVSDGVAAQNAGDTAVAEQQLQQALPQLTSPELRAPVASELGQIAEARGDFSAASARFSQAYTAREQVAQAAPDSAAAGSIEADAQQLVRALDRSGRTREACERLRQAQEQHDVAAPDAELLQRCQRQFRTNLRNDVQLSPQLQRRAIQVRPEVTPAPTP